MWCCALLLLTAEALIFNLYNNQSDDYRRKLLIIWNYRLGIQTGSLHFSLHEKKSNSAWAGSHCKHSEAAFDHNNSYSAPSDLALGIPATITSQKK